MGISTMKLKRGKVEKKNLFRISDIQRNQSFQDAIPQTLSSCESLCIRGASGPFESWRILRRALHYADPTALLRLRERNPEDTPGFAEALLGKSLLERPRHFVKLRTIDNIREQNEKILDDALANDFKWYDEMDLAGVGIYHFLKRIRGIRIGLAFSERHFPILMRKLFLVKKHVNNKALGIFSHGLLLHYLHTGDKNYLKLAESLLFRLLKYRSREYKGISWGHPFDWFSKIFIPKGIPRSVITGTIAEAFFLAYEITEKPIYRKAIESMCEFMVGSLHIRKYSKGIIFSYTPVDNYHIHNASLYTAMVLVKGGALAKRDDWMKLGLDAAKFTVNHQNQDGSWYYWAPPDEMAYKIDPYHMGYVLRCLQEIRKAANTDWLETPINKGLDYFYHHMVDGFGKPYFHPKVEWPVYIAMCSEVIILFSRFSESYPKNLDKANRTLDWTLTNMYDGKGHFYFRKWCSNKSIKKPFTGRQQAWMYRAINEYLYSVTGKTLDKKSNYSNITEKK